MGSAPTSTSRVLVFGPNWVGDAVMAQPALATLRRGFKGAHLSLLARPWVAGLYEGEGLADQIVVAETGSRLSGFFQQARRLKDQRFDLAVLLPNSFGSALLARAAGIRRVVGYRGDGRRPLLSDVVPLHADRKKRHQVAHYSDIAGWACRAVDSAGEAHLRDNSGADTQASGPEQGPGIASAFQAPILSAAPDAKDRAARLLSEHGIDCSGSNGRPILIINPGATNSRAKRWLPERFARLADWLAESHLHQTVVIGTAGDLEAARCVTSFMKTPAAVVAGKTGIYDLKGLLSHGSLVVSNDTGAAHVSAALGVPTVVVFGPTEHFATRPLGSHVTIVRRDVECSPCMLRDCPVDHRCMTRISVQDVYSAVELLNSRCTLSEAGKPLD